MAWTLKYYADPKNSPSSFVEKQINDLGWGLSQGKLSRRSMVASTLTFIADGQAYDSAPLFAYESKVVVMRDRTVNSDGSFSGGTIYFQGVTTKARRVGSATSEVVQYTFSNVWWYLTKLFFEQNIPGLGGDTTHVLLNVNPTTGVKLTIAAQAQQILDNALAQIGFAAFTYDITGLPGWIVPSDEKRDITHAEAIKALSKWAPSFTVWVDDTQAVPVVYLGYRTTMSATSVDLSGGNVVVSNEIVSLDENVVPQVIFRYEQTVKIGEFETIELYNDIYPASPLNGNTLGIMRASINLQGFVASEQTANVTSRLLDPTQSSFWIEKHEWLKTVSNLTIGQFNYTDSSGNIVQPYPFELLHDGTIHKWMTLNDGTPVVHKDVCVKANASYTDTLGNVINNEDISVRIKTTNAVTGNYYRQKVSQYAEPIPVGLAQAFYSIFSVLQYEGDIQVEGTDGEVTSQQFLGKLLNVTGGMSQWATMNALVTSVEEDLETGRVSVHFGPNKWLSPGDIIDLLRVARSRLYTVYVSQAINGNTSNTDIQGPSGTAKENSVRGQKEVNKHVVSYSDPNDSTQKTTAIVDAINKVLSLSTNNPADGQVQISLTDLQQATQ